VQHELLGLLAAPDPSRALRLMDEDGVLRAALPEATRRDRLDRAIAREPEPDALRRLAALVAVDAAGAEALAERLRFSKAARDRLVGLAEPRPIGSLADAKAQRVALYRLGHERARDLALLAAAEGRVAEPKLAAFLALADGWRPPAFPLGGKDVAALGIPPGPRTGQLLATVREWWENGDFVADRAACLARLAELAGGNRRVP
jgi:poly(A) polymerase